MLAIPIFGFVITLIVFFHYDKNYKSLKKLYEESENLPPQEQERLRFQYLQAKHNRFNPFIYYAFCLVLMIAYYFFIEGDLNWLLFES